MPIGKVWISVTVCNFVCSFVCTDTDFSAEDKASGVKFCRAVRRRPGQGISHFGELCSPRSPKSDESAIAWRTINVPVGDSTACLSRSRGVWTWDRHVWIYVSSQRRTYLFDFSTVDFLTLTQLTCEALRSAFVCLSVCRFACLKSHTPKLHVMLSVTVARSSFHDSAIRYVFPVLWMTSCFHTTKHMEYEIVRMPTNGLCGFHSPGPERSLLYCYAGMPRC